MVLTDRSFFSFLLDVFLARSGPDVVEDFVEESLGEGAGWVGVGMVEVEAGGGCADVLRGGGKGGAAGAGVCAWADDQLSAGLGA